MATHLPPVSPGRSSPGAIHEWALAAEEPLPHRREVEEKDETDEGEYPLFRGVLLGIAMVTVAVAGLTFFQHGNLEYVLAGIAAGIVLYVTTELMVPLETHARKPEDVEDPEEPDERHEEEGNGGEPDGPEPEERLSVPRPELHPDGQ